MEIELLLLFCCKVLVLVDVQYVELELNIILFFTFISNS